MPTHHPDLPPPPQPTRIFFDPFNSTSTGHQVHQNRLSGSTAWRESRTNKLAYQLRDTSGGGGKQHVSDLVGAGSEDFGKDGRKENFDWEPGAPGLRERGWQDIRSLFGNRTKRKREDASAPIDHCLGNKKAGPEPEMLDVFDNEVQSNDVRDVEGEKPPQIFRGLTMYINGSTAPLISDHRLKQLFVQRGGNTSIALGRRTVTHVVLGERAGGGLAATKIQKEISNVRGKGIKYVTAQWVIDSVEMGIRQQESRYAPAHISGRIGGSGQGMVQFRNDNEKKRL